MFLREPLRYHNTTLGDLAIISLQATLQRSAVADSLRYILPLAQNHIRRRTRGSICSFYSLRGRSNAFNLSQ